MKKTLLLMLIILFALSASTVFAQTDNGTASGTASADDLAASATGTVSVSTRANTGVVSFVRTSAGGDLMPSAQSNTPAGKSAEFFATYGAIFGISDPAAELKLTDKRTDSHGNTHLKYVQVFQGVVVFGGQLKTHFDTTLRLTAVNGVFVPDVNVSTTPSLSSEQAGGVAVGAVRQQQGKLAENAAVVESQLLVYRTGLVQGISGVDHLVYEVEVGNNVGTVREFVYVDAHTGKIVDQITGIIGDAVREISEGSLANTIWSEGDPDPIPVGWAGGTAQQRTDWQNEIDGSRETYNMFSSMAARDSYDGAGAAMRTVNNDPGISCPNANWNGTSTNYCSGVTGDDTVAHEWGHAYTEYTSNLIYQWQSGALNESYSDIWGEVVDLLNGRGTDSPGGLRTAGNCSVYGSGSPSVDDSYRWLSGEDDPAFGGAIRDMWAPTCYGDPGKVTDTQYWCSAGDGGGVHSNSGVPNHAFALMVDGGVYNGYTITALGLTKAAHIHWYAQENFLVPASDFSAHADSLEASCSALVGVNLDTLSTSSPTTGIPSGQIITAADCTEVAEINAAVQFDTNVAPICGFTTLLDPDAPPLCANPVDLTTIALEDWESGALPAGWSVATRDVANPATFDVADWAIVGSLPSGEPTGSTYAAFVSNPAIGDCDADDESGVLYLESPAIVIPGGATIPRLAFDHWVATESGYDGANLKISVNGGPWTLIPSAAYDFNAYNASLAIFGNTNPNAGQAAFTGTDGGANGGSWGQSQIDLTGIAAAGDSVKLRFEEGQDGCFGIIGWYVDNVHAYYCSGEVPSPSIDVTPAALNSAQYPDQTVNKTVSIANAGSAMLTWSIAEADGPSPNCTAPADIPWLSLAPTAGATGVGDSDDVIATFDSAGLAPGDYTATLCVSSDDPIDALVEVPITLTVKQPAGPEDLVCNTGMVSFDSGIPGNWAVIDNEGSGVVWTDIATSLEIGNYTGGAGEAATVSSDAFGPAPYDTELRSPLFDLGSDPVCHAQLSGQLPELLTDLDYLDLDISSDGGATWTTLLSWNEDHGAFRDTPGEVVAVDLSAYANMSGLMLRWRYYDPNAGDDWNWYAQIDEISLTCGSSGPAIEVAPLALASTQEPDAQLVKTLTVSNTGGTPLVWSIDESTGVAPEIAPAVAATARSGSAQRLGAPAPTSHSDKFLRDAGSPSLTNLLVDGGFETGTPNAAWDEDSFNFGTPICDVGGCGTGLGTGPHDGAYWVWFGGINEYEDGSVSQDVTIPAAPQMLLTFWLEQPVCDSAADYMEVTIDGVQVFYVDGASPLCGTVGYAQQTVDVTAYADGDQHTVEFYSATFAENGDVSNFFVDDVVLAAPSVCDSLGNIPWLSVSPSSDSTAAGAASDVSITFDSTGLAAGVYQGSLCIDSNASNTPQAIVPVELTVTPPVDGPLLWVPDDIVGLHGSKVTGAGELREQRLWHWRHDLLGRFR
jgi:Zn-dependent metalloprotease